jgi:hypothetical protein
VGELDAEGEAVADLLAGVVGDTDTERVGQGDAVADLVDVAEFDTRALVLVVTEKVAVTAAV